MFPPLPTGVHWGLERTREALSDLDNPQDRYPTIHVGGTNGKGSVASTIHSVLDHSGGPGRLDGGLYTSPHLCSFTERFQLGGGPVPEDVLVRYADEIRDVVQARELTFFEAATVLAFHLFAREGAEVVVVEVGLGGRLDATNVLKPVVAVITNVAMDHAEYLGDRLDDIAREKAGIVKAGVPVVVAEPDPGLVEVFHEVAKLRGAPLHRVVPDDIRDVEVRRDSTAFSLDTATWGRLRLRTPLVGRHQATNAATAVRALEALPLDLRPTRDRVLKGVAGVRWPGRDQVEEVDGTPWLLDVAHNTAGVLSLVDTMDRLALPEPRVALVGVLGDKDWLEMLPPLLERCRRAVLTIPPTAPEGRRWDPDQVAAHLRERAAGLCHLQVERDFERALAKVRMDREAASVVVTGSVYTVGQALRLLGRPPWAGWHDSHPLPGPSTG